MDDYDNSLIFYLAMTQEKTMEMSENNLGLPNQWIMGKLHMSDFMLVTTNFHTEIHR